MRTMAKGVRAALLAACVLGGLWSGRAAGGEAEDDAFVTAPRLTDYDLSAVDAHIQSALGRYGNGCCFLAIKDGRTLLRKAYGTFTLGKVVPIASASKMVSGAAIMALVDAGKLSLDDAAGTFFANYTGTKANMTVRQMFSHTSGFPFYTPDDFDPPHYVPEQDKTLPSMQACVDIMATVPLAAGCDPPGSGFFYTGMGMQTAGRMAEIREGKSWSELFADRIGTPLGMASADYFAFGETGNPNVAGSVQCNVDDLGKLAWMVANRGVYNGVRVLSEEAVETMLTDQTGNAPVVSSPGPGMEEYSGYGQFRYGVGCWLERFDPATGKAWEISSPGAFGCAPFVDLKRNLAGVFMPLTLKQKVLPSGETVNEGHAVYFESKQLLQGIIPEDAVLDVRANDAPEASRIHSITQPEHGTAVNHGTHATYTPEIGFVGVDRFTYSLKLENGEASEPATVTVHVHTQPVAEILGSAPFETVEGEALVFEGSGSDAEDGTNVTYRWNWGDGTPAGSGAQPSHAWDAPGTYTVTLTVTDTLGLASEPVSVEVLVTPKVDAGDLYLKSGRFAINWKAHATGKAADTLSLTGMLNPAGIEAVLDGVTLEASVNGVALGAVPLGANGSGTSTQGSALLKASLKAKTGAFAYSIRGADLRAALGLADVTESGSVELDVSVTVMGAGLDTETSRARASFQFKTQAGRSSQGKFSIRSRPLTGGLFFATRTKLTEDAEGRHSASISGAFAAPEGWPLQPTGSVVLTLGGETSPIAPDLLSVTSEGLSLLKGSHPKWSAFVLSASRGSFQIASQPLDALGVPPAGDPATAHDFRVRVVVPTANGPIVFETTIEVLRSSPASRVWSR